MLASRSFLFLLVASAVAATGTKGYIKTCAGWRLRHDTKKFVYNRGERDAYAGLGVQFEQSYLPELFITERDGAALDPPASVLLTEDGSCHLEMAELHALMAKEGFVKKPASQLRDEHAAQFAAFKRRVLAFYRAHAPAKLDDAAFAPKLDTILAEYAESTQEEDNLLVQLEQKYSAKEDKKEEL